MFSVDNFYNYLNEYLKHKKKDAVIKSFKIHGSRSLQDIILPTYQTSNDKPYRYTGQLAMFDQEPIQMEYFTDWVNFNPNSFPEDYEYNATGDLYKHLTPEEFIFRHFSAIDNPILCHSERNSPEVELFKQNHFKTVHYFYHGLIARDWFRHWAHYHMPTSEDALRFGMYCRDASGSRAYRLELLERLVPYKDQLHYNLQDPIYNINPMLNIHYRSTGDQYDSTASTTIVPEDCAKFDIQIVPETLFDTQKTHLTEKVFKPIVMRQPFIIVGPPNSLEYLESYGFKTFGDYWDESYDKILDPAERMDAILKVIDNISNMSEREYSTMIRSARGIALYNRQRFYGGIFEERMLKELHDNLDKAFEEQEQEREEMPGGTFFMYLEKLRAEGHDITDYNRNVLTEIARYVTTNDPKRGRQLMLDYKQLFEHLHELV